MDYLFQDIDKPKKVGRPKGSKNDKNDKKIKTSSETKTSKKPKSKTDIKSKKGGNFLGSIGELVAPTGWEDFATTAGLFALDRADAALRRVKKEKISKMKGGADSHDPNNWVFDQDGYARVNSVNGSYVDPDGFGPRYEISWNDNKKGKGRAVNLSNLYEKYKDQVTTDSNGNKIVKVTRKMSIKAGGYKYERIFWVNENERKLCIDKYNCTPKNQLEMSHPHVREVVENKKSINRKSRQTIWDALSDADQIWLLNMLHQAQLYNPRYINSNQPL